MKKKEWLTPKIILLSTSINSGVYLSGNEQIKNLTFKVCVSGMTHMVPGGKFTTLSGSNVISTSFTSTTFVTCS